MSRAEHKCDSYTTVSISSNQYILVNLYEGSSANVVRFEVRLKPLCSALLLLELTYYWSWRSAPLSAVLFESGTYAGGGGGGALLEGG